jgi:hypothetical protein
MVVLPSEHEGGAVNAYYRGSAASFATTPSSKTEYQYIAFRSTMQISTDAITSGARLALIYGLRSEVSPGTEIDREYHSNASGMRKLKAPLSTFNPVADSEAVPSMLLYTLEHQYTLDLCASPKFKRNGLARQRALQILAQSLGFELYATVLSYHVAATYDTTVSEKPKDG